MTHDFSYSLIQTTDGGYVVAGTTASIDGDLTDKHRAWWDAWVVKLSSSGSIVWKKSFGGSGDDFAKSIIQTSDGGYALAGYTNSTDGDVLGKHGNYDAWVIKLNSSGNIEWQKCLGGDSLDEAYSIIQTSDGGYAIAGGTYGDVSGFHGGLSDAWVIKLNSSGNLDWQKCLGGSGGDWGTSIIQTSDAGYAICGTTRSTDEGFNNHGSIDAWVIKLTSSGNVQWHKSMGGTSIDNAYTIIQTLDGGFIAAGDTWSNDGDVSGNHDIWDAWIFKLSSLGVLEWQKCLGGTGFDGIFSLTKTTDGGFVAVGSTASIDGDVSENNGAHDAWVIKLDSLARIQWQECFGGTNTDNGNSIIQTSDGGFAFAGSAKSIDGDVFDKHGDATISDFWVVKLKNSSSVNENITPTKEFSLTIFPNPATKTATLSFDLPNVSSEVVITISSITGERMQEIHEQDEQSGHHEVALDLSRFSEGTYYVTVAACGLTETTAVQVVK